MNKTPILIKKLFFFCLPFLIIFSAYFIIDPFMVLYNYDDYNKKFYIHKNLDFVSTEKYFKNSKKHIFDSFIFGSSTSLYFSPTIWKEHLNSSNEVFSFNASGEHITGIWSKINYINLHGRHIKNALLIFDVKDTFGKFINDNPIFMKHYAIYPTNKISFHYKYFLNFINFRFLVPFIHYELTHKFYPYMDQTLIKEFYYSDPITNEYFNVGILNEIRQDSLSYYEKREKNFGTRTGKFLQADTQLQVEYINMLMDIKNIFNQNHTNFRIIICPAYNQISFNKIDLETIQSIFGIQNVFDFSGINEITEKKSNYYDEFHFKKFVGNNILDTVYKPREAK
jgi:hypothetical protein